MQQNENGIQVAQPADEEIKNHGDPLAKQVRDAAGGQPEEEPPENQEANQR